MLSSQKARLTKIFTAMKKLLIYGVILSAFLSCNTDTLELFESNITKQNENQYATHKITEQDALDIADKLFEKTRSANDYTIEYILDDDYKKTRSANAPDTLAYIFNFDNNNGFAVIASDNRVFPLLAYSNNGQFKYEKSYDDPVYANFISLLDDYMATIDENDATIVIPDDYLSTCIVKFPQLQTYKWSQEEPFNKYVIQEHTGCPAGCVAVATGQLMINCKDEFYYHDSLYRCKAIREAMDDGLHLKNHDTEYPTIIEEQDTISYETAVDHVARLLYWIGKDLNMNYSPSGSAASSYNARRLLKELNYNIKENNLTNFSDTAMIQRIDEGYLLYVDGRVVNNTSEGHAWIIDGYSFCWENLSEKTGKTNISLHCDWGWGGNCNGYYSGDVFTTTNYTFGNMKYFSVNKKVKILTVKK